MDWKLLPRKTYVIHVLRRANRWRNSHFAAWWRDPQQGGMIVVRLYRLNLKEFVANALARGWKVRLARVGKYRKYAPAPKNFA